MKIKARDMKPGMVIGIDRSGFLDIALVTASNGYERVSYTHFNYQDAHGGRMIGAIKGTEEIALITGKFRAKIIKKIKDDVHRWLHDAQAEVDLLWLIQSFGEVKIDKEIKIQENTDDRTASAPD